MIKRIRNIGIGNRGFISARNLGIVGVIVLVLLVVLVVRGKAQSSGNQNVLGEAQTQVGDARAKQDVNKEFTFPIKDKDDTEIGNIKFEITSAEVRDQIIIKGKKATSIKGRTFLVLNLKITNNFEKSIQISTRDYIRLSINGNEEEWLAPDVHNDPVEVQAISTKPTRVAFPVDDAPAKFVLQIGEIKGNKEKVELSIQP